jgi:outer membrane receptor protein involved in Fe transport
VTVRKTTVLLCIILLSTAGSAALAQTSFGSVNGTVTDASSGVIPGAAVTLVNLSTNIKMEAVTNDSGLFRFVNVRPGRYGLTIALAGFKTANVPDFDVAVNAAVGRNVQLEIGEMSQSVEIVAGAELIQASSAELGNVIVEQVIKELPLNGRNFTQLLILTPGVNPVSTAQGSQSTMNFGAAEGNTGIPASTLANASVQGQQNRSKVYYIDGIINTSVRSGTYVVLPDIDSIQEFKVQSHNDKAEYGGVAGGVVNMTSKSGTNKFHGTAYEFVRNNIFDARNPQADRDRKEPLPFRQNQFGANIGGPIIKEKTFFYAAYDGWRYRDATTIRAYVPTETELNGDFSKHLQSRAIFNPFTTRVVDGKTVRDPFPNNTIPANLISPLMQGFLKAYMYKPNAVATSADPTNMRIERARKNDANALQLRIDHHFSQKDNVFFRWNEQRVATFNPQGDVGSKTPNATNRNYGGGFLHSFSPALILEVRGGVATQPTEDAPLEHPLGVAPQEQLGFPALDTYKGYVATFSDTPWSGQYGQQGPRPRGNPNWNIATDVTWLRGKHNFKTGFQFVHISRLQRNNFGELLFNSVPTKDPGNTSATGDSIAAALLGLPRQMRAYVPDLGSIDFGTGTAAGYFQDEWRVRPNLTLTLGLRYDYITRATSGDPRALQSGPDMNTGNWLLALEQLPPVCDGVHYPCLPRDISLIPHNQFIKVTGKASSILAPITDNWGPRLGVAWQLNPKTALRAGYSLLWDALPSRSQYAQHQYESWGWPQVSGFDTGDINQSYAGALTKIETLASLPASKPRDHPWAPASAYFNDPNRKDPYSHQWHLEVQREISGNLMASVAYVGSKNGRLEYAGNAGASIVEGFDVPGTPVSATNTKWAAAKINANRPWPHIVGTNWTYQDDAGWSSFQSLQGKVQRRFSDGISTLLSYTWQKSIDISSGFANAERGIGNSHIQNYHDPDSNKAVSGYDIPHLLTWGTVAELPFGKGKSLLSDGWLSSILGNWQANWMMMARSGQPITIELSGDVANIGSTGTYMRPNRVEGVSPYPDVQNDFAWINRAAFALPVNSFGNAGRNILRADGIVNVDFGLQKNVLISEGVRIELQAQAFNVFNHIDLGNPSTNWSNATTFGRITSISHPARQFQFGVRLKY